ncbi:MAG: hypothetical protein D6761_00540 [Candidatus Dadabacteria bacterium]|nr:MAG: hypothetical protein D6761_00540 [Candidatus Dadabacteria bacterium]
MSQEVIARRYAAALIAAADDAGADLGALVDELRGWAEWLASGADGAVALQHPVLPPERQLAFLDAVLAQEDASALIRGLLRVCLLKQRLPVVGRIVVELEQELDRRAGVVRGEGLTAFDLDEDLRNKIADAIGTIINRQARIEWRADRSLLSGFRVQVGHTVWDASLQHQLRRLGDEIRKGVSQA